MFKNSSLIFRFSVLFVVALLAIGGAYYLVLSHVYYSELQRQARGMADNVDAFGKWVSQYGRVWVKDKSETKFLSQMKFGDLAGSSANQQQPTTFYSKNPALAQREFSEVVAKSTASAKFRITSDNWMNPANKPDPWEAQAISAIKNLGQDEYIEIIGGRYRYARKIVHAASCVGCHGDPSTAPRDVTEQYGKERGYGYKVGDVAGIISVSLPVEPLLAASFGVLGPIEIGLIVLAFVMLYVFMHYGVAKPIRKLTRDAHMISLGKPVELDLTKLSQKSRNELGQLALAIGRLRASMELAIQRMKQGR